MMPSPISVPGLQDGSDGLAERSLPTAAAAAAARTVGVDEVIEHLSELEYGPASVRQIEGAYLALVVAGSIAVVSVAIYAYLASLAGGGSLINVPPSTPQLLSATRAFEFAGGFVCGIGGWGLLSTYLIRSGAFQDLELLARIAEPLPQSTGTTATGKSSSKESSEPRPRNQEANHEVIFSPRLLATYFFDLAYEVEEELWSITRMKGKFKSRKHCSRLAICQVMERSRIYDEPISNIEKLIENGRKMLKLLPHIKPNYKTETDDSLLEEATSEFRRITDAAALGKIGQGLCRDGECKIAKNC